MAELDSTAGVDPTAGRALAASPAGGSGALRAWIGLLLVAGGLAFLVNPGAGVLELIPDGAPLVGNLDEAAATVAVVLGVRLAYRKAKR